MTSLYNFSRSLYAWNIFLGHTTPTSNLAQLLHREDLRGETYSEFAFMLTLYVNKTIISEESKCFYPTVAQISLNLHPESTVSLHWTEKSYQK